MRVSWLLQLIKPFELVTGVMACEHLVFNDLCFISGAGYYYTFRRSNITA